MEKKTHGWTKEESEESDRLFMAAFSRENILRKNLEELSREPSEKGRYYMTRSLLENWGPLSPEEQAMYEGGAGKGQSKGKGPGRAEGAESEDVFLRD